MIKTLYKFLSGNFFTLSFGGGGGGQQQQPTSSTVTNTSLPAYAQPYVEKLFGQAGALTDINQNPYQQYGGQRLADFTPMQNQAFNTTSNMQVSPQNQQATGLAGMAGLGSLGAGQQYNQMATNPYATQAFMSPYQQNVTDFQKQQAVMDYGRQLPGMGAAASRAGAFGGSRQAIVEGEGQRNLQNQLAGIQATGSQNAFQNAQQAMQYGAGLGMQGYGQALQGASTLGQLGQNQYAQQMGINAAQQQAGAQQQAFNQQGLSNQYQDFLNRQNYPYQQLGFMSDILHGTPTGGVTTVQNSQVAPSMFSQIAGSLGGLGSLAGAYNAYSKGAAGGEVKGYAEGGTVGHFDEGGIASLPDAATMLAAKDINSGKANLPDKVALGGGIGELLMASIQLQKATAELEAIKLASGANPQTTVAQDIATQQQQVAQGQLPQQPPQGMPPQGMPPQGMPPQGMPPQGMPPQQNGLASLPSQNFNPENYMGGGIVAFEKGGGGEKKNEQNVDAYTLAANKDFLSQGIQRGTAAVKDIANFLTLRPFATDPERVSRGDMRTNAEVEGYTPAGYAVNDRADQLKATYDRQQAARTPAASGTPSKAAPFDPTNPWARVGSPTQTPEATAKEKLTTADVLDKRLVPAATNRVSGYDVESQERKPAAQAIANNIEGASAEDQAGIRAQYKQQTGIDLPPGSGKGAATTATPSGRPMDAYDKFIAQNETDKVGFRAMLANQKGPEAVGDSESYLTQAVGLREKALKAQGLPTDKEFRDKRVAEITAETAQAKKDRDVDRLLALSAGFFKMGAGKSPYALQNFAEGMGVTVEQVKVAESEFRKGTKARQESMTAMEQSRRQEALGYADKAEALRDKAQNRMEKWNESQSKIAELLMVNANTSIGNILKAKEIAQYQAIAARQRGDYQAERLALDNAKRLDDLHSNSIQRIRNAITTIDTEEKNYMATDDAGRASRLARKDPEKLKLAERTMLDAHNKKISEFGAARAKFDQQHGGVLDAQQRRLTGEPAPSMRFDKNGNPVQ